MDVQNAWNRGDEILELCMTAMQERGLSVEECLELYPEQRAELEPLLILAVRLRAGAAVQASAGLKAAAVERLRSSLAGQFTEARKKPGFEREAGDRSSTRRRNWIDLPLGQVRWWRVWAGVAVALMALALLGMGTAAAAARTLPGDLLYPLKRVQEDIQFSLALNDATRARMRLEYAERRMAEAVQVLNEERIAALDEALASYSAQIESELAYLAQEGSQLTAAQQADLAKRVLAQTERHEKSLAAIALTAPPALQKRVEIAREVSQRAKSQAARIINSRNDGSTPLPVSPALTATQTETKPPTRVATAFPAITGTPALTMAATSLPTRVPPTLTQPPSPGNLATIAPTSLTWGTPPATKNSPTGEAVLTPFTNSGVPTSGVVRTPATDPSGPTATRSPASNIRPTSTPSVQPNPGNGMIVTPKP